jgi:hypothetical protein
MAPDMGAIENCSMIGVSDEMLTAFRVDQNFPNLFNARTAISYILAADQFVTARVFDVKGAKFGPWSTPAVSSPISRTGGN